MALRWIESFMTVPQAFATGTTVLGRMYTITGSTSGVNFTDQYGRTVIDAGGAAGLVITSSPALVGAVQNTWYMGFGFRITSGTLSGSPVAIPFASYRNSGGEQLRLEFIDASDANRPGATYYKARVMRGATVLATSVEGWDQTDPHRVYFEWKAVVRTGTNGSFDLKFKTFKGLSGTCTWDAANTGINTANQGSDGADRFGMSWNTGGGTARLAFWDIYLLDSTGAKNNTYLGPLYTQAIFPDGDGSTLQWVLAGSAASIEDALDEGLTQSTTEDDKRITSQVLNDISLATMSNISAVTGNLNPIGVQARLYCKMETSGNKDVQFMYRKTTGSPAQVGGKTVNFSTTSIVGNAECLENDPNTGTDWVLADVNGLQIGVKLAS